ncbi:hypothetical protein GF415_01250 [Candidatus Micrarchaeota archaeon]|nr:hypothetical protein [Candidatus Micrarchaeota archaeon]
MNAALRYRKGTHIDQGKLREFLLSEDRRTQLFAIDALDKMVFEFGDLPPCISPAELVDIAVDSGLESNFPGEGIALEKIQEKTWSVIRRHIQATDDVSPLLRQAKKRIGEDVEVHGGDFPLKLCAYCVQFRKYSKELSDALAIGLKSPSVSEQNKQGILEIAETMFERGMDMRGIKRALKKAADGKLVGCQSAKARSIYTKASIGKFNRPPGWFSRQRTKFRMFKMSRRNTRPAPSAKNLAGKR